jgi:hypothetical protein
VDLKNKIVRRPVTTSINGIGPLELLCFFVQNVLAAEFAELFEFQLGLLCLFVSSAGVVPPVAVGTCQRDVVTHVSLLQFHLPWSKEKPCENSHRVVHWLD